MTKEEFENGYIEQSDITTEFYKKHLVTLPCECSDENCKGWAAVSNKPDTIKIHNELYT